MGYYQKRTVSSVRIVGLVIGIVMLVANFYYHRGLRWSRSGFGLLFLAACGLMAVSLSPDSFDWLRDLLMTGSFEGSRLIALATITSLGSVLLALYTRAKLDRLSAVFDRVVCAEAAERALLTPGFVERIRPVTVLIAALNEADNLALLLPRMPHTIEGQEVGVIVIDDGSTDGTAEVARRFGCLVARNSTNRGQGAALRVGYQILQRTNATIALTMDADNQHLPEDIPALIRPIIDGRADFVIGSRRLGSAEAGAALIRSLGVVVLSRIISQLSGRTITDCSSGFRAFRMSRMSLLDLREDQFQTSEVILEAAKKGLTITEVPIHIALRTHGVSKKGASVSYGFFFFKTMIKTWWR
jgi:hypothetical protein